MLPYISMLYHQKLTPRVERQKSPLFPFTSIPYPIVPKIFEKMTVATIVACHTVCKNFQKQADIQLNKK